MSAKLDDYDVDDTQLPITSFNLAEMKHNVPTYTSDKLCEIIVCDRYFGSYNELAIMCMEELAARRIQGDTFEFEKYIDNSLKDLPKLEFAVPDLNNVLRQLTGQLKKR